jgi:Ca-activated chloride channel family protein
MGMGRGFGGGGLGMGGGGLGGGGGGLGGRTSNTRDGQMMPSFGNGAYFQGRHAPSFEGKANEQYAPITENKFIAATGASAISTFSIDVDTASYSNMRRFLVAGQMPPRDSIRIEELINYFQYNYPQPKGDVPFSVNMELASCPWNQQTKLLRVGLKGKEVHVDERPATNVVFLLDVSGSMSSPDKLPLLKRGFQMMASKLGENDRVSIVTYAGNAGVALEPTTGDKTKTINEAIERLTSGGSTHGSAGIELAYKLAQTHFIKDGVNKVILATDGDLNVGVTSDDALVKLIKQKASEGVFLTVLGFGTGNLKDAKLEQLADNGNGHYAYIDSTREARRVLVDQLSGSLVTIAKDVKIQIEFNPAEVKSYRLIGYENRMLATKDFDDDKKDAGEIGAGHSVTAIYEIEPTTAVEASLTATPKLKYQTNNQQDSEQPETKPAKESVKGLSKAAESGELATLSLRYKQPDADISSKIEFVIQNDEKSFVTASNDFRFAASVAGFGMLLRGSQHSGSASAGMLEEIASGAIGDDQSGYRAEFIDLIRIAGSID